LVSATRRSLQAGVGGVKNAKEFLKLLIEPSQDDELRRYPWQYFRLVDSSGVVIEDATTNPIKTFREFVESPPLRGLGESLADIERLLADDDLAVVKLRALVVGVKGGQEGNQNASNNETNNNNIIIRSDIFESPDPPEKKATQGTSRAYTLSRLDRERPDLFELVVQGEMSANAAAIMAGWRKQATVLESLQRNWKKASEDEQRQFLEWLANEQ
jgi:hypothetical protein